VPKSSPSKNKRTVWNLRLVSSIPYLIFFLLALLVLLPIAPNLQVAPSTDSSVFLYIGDHVLKGAVPYRDVWDHKGPLIYYIDALGLVLGGGSRWGVWFIELIAVVVAAWTAYAVFKRVFGTWPAIFSSVLFVLELRLVLDKGNLVEEYALPLQFLLLWLFWMAISKPHWKNYLFLGVVAGLGLLLRPTSLGIPVAIGIYLVHQAITNPKRVFWNPVFFTLGGGLVSLGLAAIYFLSVGALPSLWDQVVTFNLAYSAEETAHWFQTLMAGFSLLSISTLFGIAGWVLALAVFLKRKKPDTKVDPLVIIGCIALPIEITLTVLAGRDFPHYFMSWLPILCLMGSFFLYVLSHTIGSENKGSLDSESLTRFSFAGLLLGLAIVPLWQLLPIAQRSFFEIWENKGFPQPSFVDHRYEPLLDYIDLNMPPDQPLLVWGNQATLNWLTHRDAPTRFVYQTPLFVAGYRSREKTNAVIGELEANPPVIIDTGPAGGLLPSLTVRLEKVPQEVRPLYHYFQEHYVYAGTFSPLGWDLYLYHGQGVHLENELDQPQN
jgi:hypothetical protein